jgi:hypothetical protein
VLIDAVIWPTVSTAFFSVETELLERPLKPTALSIPVFVPLIDSA